MTPETPHATPPPDTPKPEPKPDPSRYVTRSARIPELHLERFDTSNHRKAKP